MDKDCFKIDKCQDCYRVTRTDITGDKHTHIKSMRLCLLVIDAVINNKVPLSFSNRCLISIQRLSDNAAVINKIEQIIKVRTSKGKKQTYYNVNRGKHSSK